jgi:hypothetical protein
MKRPEMKMSLNLTDEQLKLAQWLVQERNAGKLPETFSTTGRERQPFSLAHWLSLQTKQF